MGDYLITFKPIDTSDLPEDMGARRREMARLMAEQRVAVKDGIEKFFSDNGFMDGVRHIGEPLAIQVMVISCTEEAARALREAGIPGVQDVMENDDTGQLATPSKASARPSAFRR